MWVETGFPPMQVITCSRPLLNYSITNYIRYINIYLETYYIKMYALISIHIWRLRHVLDVDFLRVGTGSCPCGLETVPTRTGKNRFLFLFLRVATGSHLCGWEPDPTRAGGNQFLPVRVGTGSCPCGWEPVPARAGENRFLPARVGSGSRPHGWEPVPARAGGNRFLPAVHTIS